MSRIIWPRILEPCVVDSNGIWSVIEICTTNNLLLSKRYDLCKVLTRSTTFFHLSLFCETFVPVVYIHTSYISQKSSSQRVLGLLIGRLDMGFHLLIFCTMLYSVLRSICPNHFNLCFLINPIMFRPLSIIHFLISFKPPITIRCSCGAIYFPHYLSFERSFYLIFLEYPCFGSISYYWTNKRVINL
jgi:hypothetical protein